MTETSKTAMTADELAKALSDYLADKLVKSPGACPTCGTCPTCGSKGYSPPYTQPYDWSVQPDWTYRPFVTYDGNQWTFTGSVATNG